MDSGTSPAAAMGTVNPIPSQIQLQVVSDLHLETPRFMPMYADFTITPRCPYLALLGDIGNLSDRWLFSFLESQLRQFAIVFYVLGNHEPYGQEGVEPATGVSAATNGHEAAVSVMEKFEADNASARQNYQGPNGIGRFVFLNRRRFDLSDTVTILGATLFSRITDEQRSTTSLFVSDFSSIKDWTVDAHNAAHAADLAWLNEQVEAISHESDERASGSTRAKQRSVVILTHYSPTYSPQANDPDHLEDDRGVQSAFATDLSGEPCWTRPCLKVWAFGHTHFNCDFVEEGNMPGQTKRIVANQRGYGREDAFDFDPDKIITIG